MLSNKDRFEAAQATANRTQGWELNLSQKGLLVKYLWDEVNHNIPALDQVPRTVKRIIETEAYLLREYDGLVYENSSLEEFITSKPLKGCGWPIDKVERVLKDDPDVLALWHDMLKRPVGTNQHSEGRHHEEVSDNGSSANQHSEGRYNITPLRGTKLSYTLSRLKREFPDQFKRVEAKELSAHAAAIEAGFRHRTFTVPDDVKVAVQKLAERFGREAVRKALRLVPLDHSTGPPSA